MRTKRILLLLAAFSILLSGSLFGGDVDWNAFSANLTKALKSDNEGLQQSAMCMVIRYADNVEIPRDAVFDIVKVFRCAEDRNERMLALVTLHKIEDPWAMDFLKRHRRFEKEERLKQLCCCSVNTYYAKQDSLKSEKTEKILAEATDQVINDFNADTAQHFELSEYGF